MALRIQKIFLSDAASDALEALEAASDPISKSVAKRVRALRQILLADGLRGEVVRQPLPAALIEKHDAENLYVEDLPGFWRLIYTLVRDDLDRNLVILEIVSHKEYDRWFPGRRR